MIEHVAGAERQVVYAERETVSKVGNHRENQHSRDVFFHVLGVIKALTYKEPHDRRCNAPDNVQRYRRRLHGKARVQQVCRMVDCHRDNRDELEMICV